MNKDKMIADIIQFIMILLLALSFVCASWFAGFEPRWLDLLLRLSGSLIILLLGIVYRDWQRRREDE